MTIDAVITWVDGSDPVLNRKRAGYGSKAALERDDVAGKERYDNFGEILWCVESINRFAPFFRKIFIVTDGQDPCLEDKLRERFPNGFIPIEIVDHKTIFQGYEEYLPVFNSLAIETMLWRIPDLAEHYVYFNDDLLLAAPVSPSDFFSANGEPVCYASLRSYALTRLSRKFKPAHGGVKKVTFKGAMINASEIAGAKMLYPKVDHTPKPHRKSFFDGFFAENPDCIIRNIRFRFRDSRQYLPDLLEYSSKRKNLARVKPSKVLFYIIPKNRPGYVKRKLDGLRKRNGIKFICNNTISRGTAEDRRLISDYVSDILNP